MRPTATVLVVVALASVALAAALDSLRGGAERAATTQTRAREDTGPEGGPAVRTPRIQGRGALRAELRRAGVRGSLFLTDRSCRLWALDLPELRWEAAPGGRAPECRFALSPDGTAVLFGRAAWAPDGRLGAVDETTLEDGEAIEVVAPARGWRQRVRGSAPAFRPDGRLTFVRRGELLEWTACPAGAEGLRFVGPRAGAHCERVVVSRRGLAAALHRSPQGLPRPLTVGGAVWLDDATSVLLVRSASVGVELLVLLRGDRAAALYVPRVLPAAVADLIASPGGTYVAARIGPRREFTVLDRRLRPVQLPPGAGAEAVTWSPDERFAVVAARGELAFFRTGELSGAIARLPVEAADVAWR